MINAEQLRIAEAVSPELPAGGNVLWVVSVIVVVGLVAAALATIWASEMTGTAAKVAWTGVVIALPVVGALAWFVVQALTRQAHSSVARLH
ncbi:PLD nuclease N-terminal domain-containing protein [Subtercola boreus]|uniref:Cardiolipin synthase N-terminal domain-containing protein n=1 Tax=Subtercola boreus TaxID=120213 RepID=A0A3E0WFQ3_9MICO|nr:PLD nuclease N-terminal domain-containing protein [Subtercola boreus]RFA22525.1 hypothetical protein B7R24_02560 [Subtercola boreus]RFA22881.1 hypothetical protein B7R23_02555 [Subtercola boreus]RFA28633.1 hypothetical protein B7R25_02570 [Subtercola boreus]